MAYTTLLNLVTAIPDDGGVHCTMFIDMCNDEIIRLKDLPLKAKVPRWGMVDADIVKHPKDPRAQSYKPVKLEDFKTHEKLFSGFKRDEANELKRGILESFALGMTVEEAKKDSIKNSIVVTKPVEIYDIYVGEPLKGIPRCGVASPYSIRIKFKCPDPDCKGHDMSIRDWDINMLTMAYMKNPEHVVNTVRDILFHKDCYFVLGTHSNPTRKNVYMLVGLIALPKIRSD